MLTLSLFSGAGLLDMAFEEAGFCVVRGPELIFGSDIRRFHVPAGRFDGVIGGPPCQAFSRLRHIVHSNGYETAPNLIPEFERVVLEAQPRFFLMENVPDAPLPVVPGYTVHAHLLNNRWLGEAQNRVRRFSFGTRDGLPLHIQLAPLESSAWEPTVTSSAGGRRVPAKVGGTGKMKGRQRKDGTGGLRNWTLAEMCRLQGLPEDFLDGAPFTSEGKRRMVGNGVPVPMGRAVAQAVRRALNTPLPSSRP